MNHFQHIQTARTARQWPLVFSIVEWRVIDFNCPISSGHCNYMKYKFKHRMLYSPCIAFSGCSPHRREFHCRTFCGDSIRVWNLAILLCIVADHIDFGVDWKPDVSIVMVYVAGDSTKTYSHDYTLRSGGTALLWLPNDRLLDDVIFKGIHGRIFHVDKITQLRLHYSQIFQAAISYYLLFKQFNDG